jgi:hypothetical protein
MLRDKEVVDITVRFVRRFTGGHVKLSASLLTRKRTETPTPLPFEQGREWGR